jgi:hypothetical protein
MKRLIATAVASVVALAATSAFAGVHIEHVTRNIKTKAQDGSAQTMLVQNGMLRNNASSSGGMILKGSTIIIIDDKRKQYREMRKEDMKKMAEQAGAAMARMQEQMKNLTPEQRAMMEKAMGSQIAGGIGSGKPDVWTSKNLGRSDSVEGRNCQLWTLSRNGALFEELCVVPYSSLPGKEDFQKVFKEMAEAFEGLAKAMPNADASVKARTEINGYTVRSRMYDGNGQLRGTETVMTKWVEESIPASAFEVPSGYTKAELPQLKLK